MTQNPSVPHTDVLNAHECWSFLRDTSIGRLAVVAEGRPDVFPVNFRIHENDIVFRTAPGTKLAATSAGAPVALEIDGIDSANGVAWSVVVKGQAMEAPGSEGLRDSMGGRLFPWAPGSKDHFIRISPEDITGRRFKLASQQTWDMSLDEALRSGLE